MISVKTVSTIHLVKKGEEIPVLMKIKNPTIFPISNLAITIRCANSYSGEDHKRKLMVSIDSNTTSHVSCNITSEHVGNLRMSISEIRVYDYLRIFSRRKKINQEFVVGILPNFYELSKEFLIQSSGVYLESDYFSQFRRGDDPSEVFEIREYQPGDRPQRIHWKLSAKQDELMIKNFSEPVNCSILLFVDLNVSKSEGVLEYIDGLLESTLSLSYTFLQEKQRHFLAWYDNEMDMCRRVLIAGEDDLYEAIDGLFQAMPYIESKDSTKSYMAQYPNEQYTDFFYVTVELYPNYLDTMAMLDVINRQIIHIHNMDEDAEGLMLEELADKLNEAGIGLSLMDLTNIKEAMAQV